MKLVQFIHPMFLAALGLHVSLMFVPVGSDAEPDLIEEDVPLAELTEDASKATPQRLPVPDLDVDSKGTIPKAATAAAARATSASPTPPRKAPPKKVAAAGTPAQVTSTGNVRSAGSATTSTTAGSSNAGAQRSTASTSTAQNASTQNTAPQTASAQNASAPDPSETTPSVVDNSPEANTTSSDSDADAGLIGAASSSTGGDRTGDAGNESGAGTPTLGALIESVQAKLPSSLESSVLTLAEALVYRAEGTDDNRAAEMREAWANTVNPLASRAGAVSRVAPTIISDVELNYPIAAAVVREGRSLDVCLDETPSNAEIGLLFDSQGELAIEPEVLRSTGYEALNLELIEMLKNEENFPSDRQSKAYIYEVSVNYDAEQCVNLNELKS